MLLLTSEETSSDATLVAAEGQQCGSCRGGEFRIVNGTCRKNLGHFGDRKILKILSKLLLMRFWVRLVSAPTGGFSSGQSLLSSREGCLWELQIHTVEPFPLLPVSSVS